MLLTLLALNLVTPFVSAETEMVGPNIKVGAIPQACGIEIYAGAKLFGFCSGTLTGPKEITTAAHCIKGIIDKQNDITYRIGCGLIRMRPLKDPLPNGPTEAPVYSELRDTKIADFEIRYHGQTAHDTGHLHLMVPITTIVPAKVLHANDVLTALQNSPSPVNFRLYGTGMDVNHQVETMRTGPILIDGLDASGLTASQIWRRAEKNPTKVNDVARIFYLLRKSSSSLMTTLIAGASKMKVTQPLEGDSGGGLFMQTVPNGPWTLVATTSNLVSILQTISSVDGRTLNFGADPIKDTKEYGAFVTTADNLQILLLSKFALIDADYRPAPVKVPSKSTPKLATKK